MPDALTILGMAIAAFGGGLFGAALGALPAFILCGFLVIGGEAANIASRAAGMEAAEVGLWGVGVTGQLGFGPLFGPHVAFAGGAAATAYAARQGYMDSGWGYHDAKNILAAFSSHRLDVLVVGGVFGTLGYLFTYASEQILAAPWDPVAMGVVFSAVVHRLAFGYDLMGTPAGDGFFDLTPFERGERRAADGGDGPTERLAAEPWLDWQYEWRGVGVLGIGVGIAAGFIYWATGSPYLGFGISAASLIFMNASVDDDFANIQVTVPVTHHITLPASTAPMAYTGLSLAESWPSAIASQVTLLEVLTLGAIFGLLGALAGEVIERLFYAHGDTHFDPPAASIAFTTFVIAVLAMLGVFPTAGWVPTPI